MNYLFHIAAAAAVLSTLLAVTRAHAVHALLYAIVSLISVSLVFLSLGAPFLAALEVIVYAGAIMVLFIFVVMMLNVGPRAAEQEREWMRPGTWAGPAILSALLLSELVYVLVGRGGQWTLPLNAAVSPVQLGLALFGPYLLGVELAAMLLLAGLVGAYHLGRRDEPANEAGR